MNPKTIHFGTVSCPKFHQDKHVKNVKNVLLAYTRSKFSSFSMSWQSKKLIPKATQNSRQNHMETSMPFERNFSSISDAFGLQFGGPECRKTDAKSNANFDTFSMRFRTNMPTKVPPWTTPGTY